MHKLFLWVSNLFKCQKKDLFNLDRLDIKSIKKEYVRLDAKRDQAWKFLLDNYKPRIVALNISIDRSLKTKTFFDVDVEDLACLIVCLHTVQQELQYQQNQRIITSLDTRLE